MHANFREVLQHDVLRMIATWARKATQNRNKMINSACRAHAHLALLYKNVSPRDFTVEDVSTFVSSQIFLNTNYQWFRSDRAAQSPDKDGDWLGICEVELFDMFEAKRSLLAKWFRDNSSHANEVLEVVERVVTFKGTVAGLFPGQAEQPTRDWVELSHQPGNFLPRMEAPDAQFLKAQDKEKYQPWMLRTTQGTLSSSAQISLNLGQYKTKRGSFQFLSENISGDQDYKEGFGKTEVHCADQEITSRRVCKDLVGQRHQVHRWDPDDRQAESDSHVSLYHKYRPSQLGPKEKWLAEVLEPVRRSIPCLSKLALYVQGAVSEKEAELAGTVGGQVEYPDEAPAETGED